MKELERLPGWQYDLCVNSCPFSDEELTILDMKRRQASTVAIAQKTNLSSATVGRRIAAIKAKINAELM